MFRGRTLRLTAAITFMNACALFAWWGLNSWVPAYLSLPPAQGGVGLATETMSWFVVAMQVGMWLGYVTFGYIGDAFGRKRVYVTYLLVAAVLLPLYGAVTRPAILLLLGPFVAFFGTGYFSGFGAVTAEIYPTAIRATAQGFTYNVGPRRERGGAVHDRDAGRIARLRDGVRALGGSVPARRAGVGGDSGDRGARAELTGLADGGTHGRPARLTAMGQG